MCPRERILARANAFNILHEILGFFLADHYSFYLNFCKIRRGLAPKRSEGGKKKRGKIIKGLPDLCAKTMAC